MAQVWGTSPKASPPATSAWSSALLRQGAKHFRTAASWRNVHLQIDRPDSPCRRVALGASLGTTASSPVAWDHATIPTSPRTCLCRSASTPAAMDTSLLPCRLERSSARVSTMWTCAKRDAPRTKTANRSPTIPAKSSAAWHPLPQTHPAPRPTAANRGAPTLKPSPLPPAHPLPTPTPCGASTRKAVASLMARAMGTCSQISAPHMRARNCVPLTRSAKHSRTARV